MTPRKNESKFKLKKYDHLYRFPDRPGIYYKRWSPEKGKDFLYSTGLEDPRAASKIGKEKYDEWLGVHIADSGERLMRDYGKAIVAKKEGCKGGKFGASYRQAVLQNRHMCEGFGHLWPHQVTPHRWDIYDQDERKRVRYRPGKLDKTTGKRAQIPYTRTTTNHTREFLMECLILAHEKGAIRAVPKLTNHDGPPDPPRAIPKDVILRMIRSIGRQGRGSKLLFYIAWKQGARPSEILQYRQDMIDRSQGKYGVIHIPAEICKNPTHRTIPLNSRVSKLLRRIQPLVDSPYLIPSRSDPEQHQKDYKTAWQAARARVGVDFEAYNLRDTFVSEALAKGKSSDQIAYYIQNSPQMIRQRYAVWLMKGLEGVAE